jgi:hypothetical protein
MAGYSEIADRVKDLPLEQLTGEERMVKLWEEHPDTYPKDDNFPGLIDPPSQWATTEQHERFRKSMAEAVAASPENPHYPLYLACSERVLAWRATLAPADRYWETWPRRRSRPNPSAVDRPLG